MDAPPSLQRGSNIGRWLMFISILLFTFAPLLGVFLADLLARNFGCRASEAGGGDCVVAGMPLGSLLDFLMLCGWLSLLTLPLGAVLLGIYLVYLAVRWARRRRV